MPAALEDYALIGDRRTAALVAKDGSIDWLCLPRFDSGACFAALLGEPGNGRWQIAPTNAPSRVTRAYRAGTLVLETTFEDGAGAVRVIDFMPLGQRWPRVIRETPIHFGQDQRLYGVIAEPISPRTTGRPAVLLLNVGADNHVGPHRMNTEIGRELAAMGHVTLRFDVGGLGESAPSPDKGENRLYRMDSVDDVQEAMSALERLRGCSGFVLVGLCSGAFLAYRGGRRRAVRGTSGGDRGARTLMAFSESDGGLDMIARYIGVDAERMAGRSEFSIEIVRDVDHTFSTMASQERLRAVLYRHIDAVTSGVR